MTFGPIGDLGAAGQQLASGFSDLARTADIVEDATVIALAAVRQKVKNRLVVRALRDGADYDQDWLLMAASLELVALASEKDAEALRLDREVHRAKSSPGRGDHPSDYRLHDVQTLKRRRKVLRRLANRLRSLSVDHERQQEVVSSARRDALEEIAAAIASGGSRLADSHVKLEPADRSLALWALKDDLAELAMRSARLAGMEPDR